MFSISVDILYNQLQRMPDDMMGIVNNSFFNCLAKKRVAEGGGGGYSF